MHDDPKARHRAVPPGRCGTDMGLRWPHQFPSRRSEFFPFQQGPFFPSDHAPACFPLWRSNDFPVGDHTLQILAEEVCHLHPHRQWPGCSEPAVRSSFQAGQPLLDAKQDDGSMSSAGRFLEASLSENGLVVTSAERVGIFHNPGGLPARSNLTLDKSIMRCRQPESARLDGIPVR